jgi:hypothetical protein
MLALVSSTICAVEDAAATNAGVRESSSRYLTDAAREAQLKVLPATAGEARVRGGATDGTYTTDCD